MTRPAPRLRWYSDPVTRAPIFVVPGDNVGESSVVPRGKTWGIRERGDTGGQVVHEYCCPVHGRFDARVSRRDVPDEVDCPADCVTDDGYEQIYSCRRPSPWAGSACAIGIEPGMVTG